MNNLEVIKEKIHGPVFPIPTPFKNNEEVDYDALVKYVQFLLRGGAKIIHVMVHTSRFPLLTEDEMLKVNRVTAETAKGIDPDCIVIVADPWMCSTETSIRFAKEAKDSGADVIGLIYGERVYHEDDVYNHFKKIADAVPDIGILIHEQALFTIRGTELMQYPRCVLKKICEIPSVIALKEDAKDDIVTQEVLDTVKDDVSIIVSGGSKEQFMKFYKDGMQAYLVGIASFDPEVAYDFYNAMLCNNMSEAQNIIDNLEKPFFEVSKKIGWHIGLKSALDHLGIMKRSERSPMVECTEEEHANIKDVMRKSGWM